MTVNQHSHLLQHKHHHEHGGAPHAVQNVVTVAQTPVQSCNNEVTKL